MLTLVQMLLFSLSMSILPGPTNIISASYGKEKGLLQTISFISGAAIGFSSLAIILGIGLENSVGNFPDVMDFLKYVGGLYLIFLSVCMVFYDVQTVLSSGVKGKFFDGFFIQWVNPRCWVSAMLVVSTYNKSFLTLAFFIGIDLIVNSMSKALWAYAGEQVSGLVVSPGQKRLVNTAFGLSLGLLALQILYS